MKKKLYNSPSMEIHALKVERGFAGSDGIYDVDFGDPGAAGNPASFKDYADEY